MLKVVALALALVLCTAACNGVLGNTESSRTDDHLFDPSGNDGAADASTGDAGDTFDAASVDDAPFDAGPDGVVDAAVLACGTPAFVNTCLDCPGKTMRCAGACVASCRGECGGLTGAPVECFACNDAGTPEIAVCEPAINPGACLAGHQRCKCATAAECPGPAQVCNGTSCYACGEGSTDGVDCKIGGQCDNQFDMSRFTCH